ncbi:MAG: polysaccharide deacetylase family protein [Clostridia bacterium]|nr:polysaccharide deacetylase family protein [Clostridia bacterium]
MKKVLCLIMAMLMITSVLLTACEADDTGDDTTTTTTTTTTTSQNPPAGPEDPPAGPEDPPTPPPADPVYDPDLGISDAVVDDGVTVSGDLKVLIIGDAHAAGSVDYLNEIAMQMGYENVTVGCVYSFYKSTINYYNMSTTLPSRVDERFMYRKRTSTVEDEGEWDVVNYETTIMAALENEQWDSVILTETYYEAALASYNTQSATYLDNNAKFKSVVNSIKTKCPNAKIYFQTCYADIASNHEDWYNAVIGNLTRTTKDAAIDGIIPVATAVQNFYEGMPIYEDVTVAMSRYTASMAIASCLAGKNPATVARDSEIFKYKVGVAVMREAVQNAKNTPNATTDSVVEYNYYTPKSDEDKYLSDDEFFNAVNVEIDKYYHGTSYAVSLTFDDGDVASAEICAEILRKYGVSASFYIQSNSNMTNENWSRWEKLIRDFGDCVDIGSHDYTDFQNRSDTQSATVDAELEAAGIDKMKKMLDSYSILSAISPYESVVSYCTPGAGVKYMNRKIQMKFPIFAGDRVGANLDGKAANTPYASDFDEEDFYSLGSGNLVRNGNILFANHTANGGSITFAQQNNGWFIPLQHGLFPKTDSNKTEGHTAPANDEGIEGYVDISRENLEAYCQQLQTLGGAWLGSYNDVLKYVREAKTATYEVLWANDNTIAIKLSTSLDRRFNHPLSIRVRVTNDWLGTDKLTVRQGNYVIPVASVNKSSKTSKIYIPEAIPNGEIIYIERITE